MSITADSGPLAGYHLLSGVRVRKVDQYGL
jgi:hypothetical protein